MSAFPHVSPDVRRAPSKGGSSAEAGAGAPHASMDLARRPFVLAWEVTQACELACRHCRANARDWHPPGELTTEEGKALLREARRFGPGQIVVLTGGDPLSRDDVVELVRYGAGLGLRMTMTPSGTSRLTRARLRALRNAGLERLALSLDGANAERHDAFRGVAGSFALTVRAARWARELGLPLQVNSVVTADTVDDLPQIRILVEDLGAVMWEVFFLVPVGRGTRLRAVSPERAERVARWLLDTAHEAPFTVKAVEAPFVQRAALQRGRGADAVAAVEADRLGRHGGVRAGNGFAFVSHVGEVFPAGFLPRSAGNVRDASVVDLYRDAPLFRALRNPDGFAGKCGACPFRHVCGGSRSRAFAVSGDPLGSDPLCGYIPPGYHGPLPEEVEA